MKKIKPVMFIIKKRQGCSAYSFGGRFEFVLDVVENSLA
jgi:hypothetical protein